MNFCEFYKIWYLQSVWIIFCVFQDISLYSQILQISWNLITFSSVSQNFIMFTIFTKFWLTLIFDSQAHFIKIISISTISHSWSQKTTNFNQLAIQNNKQVCCIVYYEAKLYTLDGSGWGLYIHWESHRPQRITKEIKCPQALW